MKNTIRRALLLTLASLLSATILTACGGGGSSSGSGGLAAGSASISGNVHNGIALLQPDSPAEKMLARLIELTISDAHAGGVQGATVELLDSSGNVLGSQTTDTRGNYEFNGLAPGNYKIKVMYGGQEGITPNIQLTANTRTRLDLSMNGGVTRVEVEAENGRISGEVEDSVSHDDDSEDNVSEDDVSEDDTSEDDESEDNDSEDDDDNSDDDCERRSGAANCEDND